MFARYKKVRVRVQKALEDACSTGAMKEAVSAAPLTSVSALPTVTYWRSENEIEKNAYENGNRSGNNNVDEDEDNGDDENATSINDSYDSTPLLSFNLFSYQPGIILDGHDNIALAVYGTVL